MYRCDFCPGDDLQTFYDLLPASRRIERVGRSKLIQKNLTEPDVELFMNFIFAKFGSSHEKFYVWPRH